MYKARAAYAQRTQSTIDFMATGSAMAAFEQMEDKMLSLEAPSTGAAELGGTSIEQQFANFEADSSFDDELVAASSFSGRNRLFLI